MTEPSQSLVACPFCGGEATVSSESCGWRVDCIERDCYTRGPWPDDCTEAEAIAAWNTRAPDPRDATIALQDKRIAELEGEVGWLREALVRVEARLRPHPEDDTPADDRRYRHTAHSIARTALDRMPLPSPPAASWESGG